MESSYFPPSASPRLKKVTNAGTYPAYSVVTGTFTTVGTTVTFSADTPREQVQAGDFLYSTSNNQVRRIKTTFGGANTCTLEEAFDTDVSSAEDNAIVYKSQRYRGIAFYVTGAGDCVVDGTDYVITDSAISYYNSDGLDPIAYDATGSELMLVIQK